VFGTQPLQVADLDPLFDGKPATGIRPLGNLETATPFPLVSNGPGADLDDVLPAEVRELRKSGDASSLSHEAWPSHDGTKLYLGAVTAQFEVFTILDITAWLERDAGDRPAGPPRIISQRSGRGHSVRTATVRSGDEPRRYVLHSEEAVFGTAYGCLPETLNPFAGAAQPWLTDITDEANPVLVSQFGLEINRPENCLAQLSSRVNSSSHYHDVDDTDDSTFAMVSMWESGLRVFDIRDPARPVEVAYFNPADVGATDTMLDKAWGHIRYVADTGHIWFATESGGFWVVELAPKVREYLAMEATPVENPNGRPGTDGVGGLTAELRVDTTGVYCTLSPTMSLASPAILSRAALTL
jgi:hypothetical protein